MARSFGRITARVAGGQEEYALEAATVTLGRATVNDIVLPDPRVSRRHARVECGEAGCTIVDLDSANGTHVNGVRVERASLQPGDAIVLGDSLLRFETAPAEELPDVTRLDSAADVDATLAQATLPIRLNDSGDPRLAVQTRDRTWEIALDRDALTIGRDPASDVCLDDAAVSRHHARIERRGDCLLLRDLGSTNGTWLGARRVDETELRPGQTVRLGSARLVVKPRFGPDDLTLVEEPARAGAGEGRRPVVFVPGMTGSELWRGSERVWPNPRLLLSEPELFRLPDREPLRAGGVIGEVVVIPNLVKVQAYSRIAEYLVEGLGYERGRDVLEFGYDWRQDVRQSARQLAEAIEGWHVTGPVTLIAHSLGCLVSRYYVERLGGDRRVGRLILMGGPHLGTPGAVSGLVLGPRLLPFGLMGDRLRDVAATFPSTYQILPTYPCVLDHDGQPIEIMATPRG